MTSVEEKVLKITVKVINNAKSTAGNQPASVCAGCILQTYFIVGTREGEKHFFWCSYKAEKALKIVEYIMVKFVLMNVCGVIK